MATEVVNRLIELSCSVRGGDGGSSVATVGLAVRGGSAAPFEIAEAMRRTVLGFVEISTDRLDAPASESSRAARDGVLA